MMSPIVRTSSKLLFPFILAYGLYIVANGHLTPGGGFQGGVVMAMAFYLYLLSFGHEKTEKIYDEAKLSITESFGSLLFIGIAFAGLLLGFKFMGNWLVKGTLFDILSAGFMLPLNFAIGLKVAAGVFTIALLFVIFAEQAPKVGEEKTEAIQTGEEDQMIE
ncbi:MAG: hypothetical protein NT157_01105 [Candidatus Micrarchaeota archaeon]|nr:hypothetical protein [Candidatus Micrarchaeota archaeon]